MLLKKADVFKTVIPTKMLEFMACGRPVILGVDGQARRVLEEARAGIFIEPENPAALSQAVTELYHNVPLRRDIGHNGHCYIKERLSRERTAHVYTKVLEEVVFHWKQHSV